MDSLHFAPTFSYFSTENCSYSGKKRSAFICHYVRARCEDFFTSTAIFSFILFSSDCFIYKYKSLSLQLKVAACLTCSLNELHFRHCSVSDKKYLRTALLEV